jgi:N-acetylglucosaminyldiphosphoundecaprenol N-acetyl-beta-D-mannosaminyltransferase
MVDLFLARGFPRDALAYHSPPYGFEKDEDQSRLLWSAIQAHATTDLILGVGAPKSEVWIDVHRDRLGDVYAYAFGGGLDFLVGTVTRAPVFMRRLGFEWMWRLAQEPARLWRRYLVDSWAVLPCIVEDLAGRAPHGSPGLNDDPRKARWGARSA